MYSISKEQEPRGHVVSTILSRIFLLAHAILTPRSATKISAGLIQENCSSVLRSIDIQLICVLTCLCQHIHTVLRPFCGSTREYAAFYGQQLLFLGGSIAHCQHCFCCAHFFYMWIPQDSCRQNMYTASCAGRQATDGWHDVPGCSIRNTNPIHIQRTSITYRGESQSPHQKLSLGYLFKIKFLQSQGSSPG